MRIVKPGRILDTQRRFTCTICGCVFEVEKDEYKHHFYRNEDYYSCVCPMCNNTSWTSVPVMSNADQEVGR